MRRRREWLATLRRTTPRNLPMTLLRYLLPVLALLGLAMPVQAEPAIWAVRDKDSTIWLFGSIHVLPVGMQWQTGLFNGILANADKVVFETDLRGDILEQIGAQAFVRGVYVDGSLLTDRLNDDEEARLRLAAETIGMPIGPMLAMRPWMAANAIEAQALAGRGADGPGVELLLQPGLASKRLDFLETAEQQLDVLAGAPEDEQVAMLLATVDQIPTMPKILDKMLDSWRNGRPEKLNTLISMGLGGSEAAILDRILYARNENWIAPLETMLAEGEENLVIVGAAHLIGDRSVLALLEQAGYTVERIQ